MTSVRGVRPLVAVDGHTVGAGEPGSTTRKLADAVAKLRVVGNRAIDEHEPPLERGRAVVEEERA